MNSKVSGIMKQLVPCFLMAYPTASKRTVLMPCFQRRPGSLAVAQPAPGLHIQVDLFAGECCPQEGFLSVRQGVGEWQTGTRAVNLARSCFGCAVGEHVAVRQEHPAIGRLSPPLKKILKLLGFAGNVIDDQIGSNVDRFSQRLNVLPGPHIRINRPVINGIEPCISAIDGHKKRQNMHPGKQPFERSIENLPRSSNVDHPSDWHRSSNELVFA